MLIAVEQALDLVATNAVLDTYTPRQFHHVYMRDGKIVTAVENDMEQPRSRGIAQVPYFD